MYELIKLNSNDYYVDCPSRMGIVNIGGDEVVMIDAGNDKDAGKKALRHIEANGWKLKAVYITHSHADHIGGCHYLQSHTECKIYAQGIERDMANHTEWEAALLFGGIPPREFENKTFHAQASEVSELTQEMLLEGFELIQLPGHSIHQIGIMTPNRTVYLGDAILEQNILEKYPVSYVFDIETYVKTLESLKELDAEVFVPAHATHKKDIKELADFNINTVKAVASEILDICKEPLTVEQILKRVFDAHGITMSIQQFCLVGTTVKSYLVWMRKNEKVEMFYENNEIFWKSTDR